MRVGEFKRELRQAGCYLISHGGNHDNWYSPLTNQKFQVPRHDNQEMGARLEGRLRKVSGVNK